MKMILICMSIVFLLAGPAFAEEKKIDELALLQAQRAAVEWEFRYCNERMKVLNEEAGILQEKINNLLAERERAKEQEEDE